MRTLSGTMEKLARQGYTQPFRVRGSTFQALGTGQVFRAHEVVIRQYHRFEGGSRRHVDRLWDRERERSARNLVDAFGAYSSPVVGAFLDKVRFDGHPQPARLSEREEGS